MGSKVAHFVVFFYINLLHLSLWFLVYFLLYAYSMTDKTDQAKIVVCFVRFFYNQ